VTALHDRKIFFQKWLKSPLTVGSLTPSAPHLVSVMLRSVPWNRIDTVVELGAGTGPITAGILKRKPERVRFLAFEREPAFRQLLAQRYPGLSLYPEAKALPEALAATGRPQADVIISGIPFAALSARDQEHLLSVIDASLAPGGQLIAFQYSLMLYARLRQRFARCDLSLALLNLPPAAVYTCYKAAGA